jgi:hypothetical protein
VTATATSHSTPDAAASSYPCRFCGAPVSQSLVDLGFQPLCEAFRTAEQLDQVEQTFALHPKVCPSCFLVQVPAFVSPEEIFREYAYYSAFSTSWLDHAKRYTDLMIERFGLGEGSFVCELASNDGYLLQYFLGRGPKVLGIEPSYNVAKDAEERGVRTITEFFGVPLAEKLVPEEGRADLILGNNVFAQVPDLNDFVAGMKLFLNEGGVITLEWPHLLRLIEEKQFDTIYHEHFGYFSLYTTERIFAAHGLKVWDVEELGTHGGSLRVYGAHADDPSKSETDRLQKVRADEAAFGIDRIESYQGFAAQVEKVKDDLLLFLIEAKRQGKTVAAYGAPGKGNTFLNYAGIRPDLVAFTCDRNPYKHGRFTPGTNIPIFPPDHLEATKPDYTVIMPWNLKAEIVAQLSPIVAQWGGKLVVAIPELEVIAP